MKPDSLYPRTLLFALLALSLPTRPCKAEPESANALSSSPVKVLVANYSHTEHTEQMAKGVVEGVERTSAATATLKKVDEVTKADLESADAIVLGCPTYYGNIPRKGESRDRRLGPGR